MKTQHKSAQQSMIEQQKIEFHNISISSIDIFAPWIITFSHHGEAVSMFPERSEFGLAEMKAVKTTEREENSNLKSTWNWLLIEFLIRRKNQSSISRIVGQFTANISLFHPRESQTARRVRVSSLTWFLDSFSLHLGWSCSRRRRLQMPQPLPSLHSLDREW